MRKVRQTLAHAASALFFATLIRPELLPAQAQKYEGQQVLTIQFDPKVQPIDPDELHDILPLHKDEPMHMDTVRASIERLYATGRYSDIQVDVEPYSDGTRNGLIVKFLTKNSWFIGNVTAGGHISSPPHTSQLESVTALDLGQPYTETKLQEAIVHQQRLLEGNGFFLSHVTPNFDYDQQYQQVNIRFDIDSGPRANFSQPEFLGDLKLDPEKVSTATKFRRWLIHTWKPMTQTRVQQGLSGVRALYQKENRLEAKVSLDSMKYDQSTNSAKPTLNIDAGPRIQVNVIGTKISQKKLQRYVPIFEEHAVDHDLILEGARNLQDYLQSAGYFDAQVQPKEQRVVNDRATIDFLANAGLRHKLVSIQINGNKYFTTAELRERMYLRTATFLQFPHGRYSENLARQDVESIANLYRSNGFRDVDVPMPKIVDNYNGRKGEIAVIFTIKEGAQTLIDRLQVDGIQNLDREVVIGRLSSVEGQPFSEFTVAVDRDTILAQYFDKGFPKATFEWSVQNSSRPNRVDVHYVIREGKQEFVRQVLTNQLTRTRTKLVNRNLTLNPGDPLSPTEITETQRRLYALGVFAKVDAAIQNPDGDSDRKYVLYQMEEASRYSLATGFGAELGRIGGCSTCLDAPAGATGFSPRVSLDITRNNLWGIAHSISLRTRFSTLDQRALLNYSWPRFLGDKLNVSLTGLFENSRDVRTFDFTREEASAQVENKISKATTLFYRLAYRRVSIANLQVTSFLIPLLSQPVRVGIASINLVQDRRDDPVDPHKGVYNTVDLGLAERYIGSQRNFARLLVRNSSYYPIGKRIVLARSTEFGDLYAFKYSGNALDAIPLAERFFGGGGNSDRGFPENQAGPRDTNTGFPLGGNALLFNQTELRFPLIGDDIGGVLYHDMGNIYTSLSHLSFRTNQHGLDDFDYMVHAVGFGLRYRTPIGPVRVDLGYSINPPYFNGFKGTEAQLLSAGTNPCPAPNSSVPYQCVVQNVSHFQFFFSIGQTF